MCWTAKLEGSEGDMGQRNSVYYADCKKEEPGGEHFQVSVLVLITGRRTSGVLSVGESRSVHRLVPNGKVVINNSQWYS